MHRLLICIFALTIALAPLHAAAEEGPSLEQVILQQHFTQKELERNLELIQVEEAKLGDEIVSLDADLKRQATVIDAMGKHAGQVALAYYKGERTSILTLLFDAENFNDFLFSLYFLQALFEQDIKKLEDFQQERETAKQLQTKKQERLSQVKTTRAYYEKRLAEMLAVQKEKEANLQKLKDPTSIEGLMTHLIDDWRTRGLPVFRNYFGVLAQVMMQLPELVTPENLQSRGLFRHTLTIEEDEFNEFLVSKNELFQSSRFQFTNDQLVVEGQYDQMTLKLVGSYELVSPTELKFHIQQLKYDGFELPASSMEELEKEYNLGFYPAALTPNIRVESISLRDAKLTLTMKYELPF
ncbi:coiled-coil domain-containing protein [Brevibacillus dissolubilis]|uniref:coiled-coil domain-containing protein n=1 Tax=Brevibacillus dissolubilis TaxID=1844116 RepID=UPI0011175D3D|nr:hypothetical protein [Brevibacillus dissolubilis]